MSDGEFQLPKELIETLFEGSKKEVEQFWAKLKDRELFPESNRRAREFLEKIKTKPMTGIEKIAQERLEQKTVHNHTLMNDYQQYPDFELMDAAVAILQSRKDFWPSNMDAETFDKISKKSYEERLVVAGALIAAEIDRLNYTE